MPSSRRAGIASLFSAALLLFSVGGDARTAGPLTDTRRGLQLVWLPPAADARFDVSIVSPEDGVDRLKKAVDMIYEASPESAAAIDRLKEAGPVILFYHPHNARSEFSLNTQNIALFIPDFIDRLQKEARPGKEFPAIVNHHGIKSPVKELAAILVHELVGHGMQHLRGDLKRMRLLDVECEAYLYQERAYQDFRMNKHSKELVGFRKQMEQRYCTDFKTYMRRAAPEAMSEWNKLNPSIPRLLGIFERYREQAVR